MLAEGAHRVGGAWQRLVRRVITTAHGSVDRDIRIVCFLEGVRAILD